MTKAQFKNLKPGDAFSTGTDVSGGYLYVWILVKYDLVNGKGPRAWHVRLEEGHEDDVWHWSDQEVLEGKYIQGYANRNKVRKALGLI